MENLTIQKWLEVGSGDGYGSGDGSDYGSDFGYGSGDGSGYGSGYGYGYGYGSGDGSGYGSGDGYGSGYGSGDSLNGGIKLYCGKPVYIIDHIPTIITSVFANMAKGYILQSDLTLTPCYIAKQESYFAHGETLEEAIAAVTDKLFDGMPEDERIAEFWECHKTGVKYPASDLYEWHHRLTGSCEMGRKTFAAEHGIDLDSDMFTVDEFVELCGKSYGGEIIQKLAAKKMKNKLL